MGRLDGVKPKHLPHTLSAVGVMGRRRERERRVLCPLAHVGRRGAVGRARFVARVGHRATAGRGTRWPRLRVGASGVGVGDEDEDVLLVGVAGGGAGVALDHTLRSEVVLDLLTEYRYIVVFLRQTGAQ